MKKKLVIGILLMLVLATISILPNALANPEEGNPFVTDLIAGQHTDVGDIEVWDNGNTLYVTYKIDHPWVMTESHVHIGNTFADFPLTKKGSPKVGHFEYSEEHNPPVTTYMYEIPYDGEIMIATHAVVWDYSCFQSSVIYGMQRSTGKVWAIDIIGGTAWEEFQTIAPLPSHISPNGLGYDAIHGRFYYVDYTEATSPENLYCWDGTNEFIAGQVDHQIAAGSCSNGQYYYVPSWPGSDDLYVVNFNSNGYVTSATKLADMSGNQHAWTFDGDIAVKDGVVYGWGRCSIHSKYEFFTYDITTTVFNLYNVNYQSSLQLAFGSNGVLYGHRSGTAGNFYEIDTTSGVVTLISPTPTPANWYTDCASGMIFEPNDSETAWGDGEDFPGKNWAMYFYYPETPCRTDSAELEISSTPNPILANHPVFSRLFERFLSMFPILRILYN